MNYLNIVNEAFSLDGRFERFFIHNCKEAEKKYYTKEEFFRGCLKIISKLESIAELNIQNRYKELYLLFKGEQSKSKDEKSTNLEFISTKILDDFADLNCQLNAKSLSESTLNKLQNIKEGLLDAQKQLFVNLKENELLIKEYIWEDRITDFKKINNKFLEYWSNNKKTKKDVIYYLHFLITKEFFKGVFHGKKFKATHGKDFLSIYFYEDKKVLSGAKKLYYNKITTKNNHLHTIIDI